MEPIAEIRYLLERGRTHTLGIVEKTPDQLYWNTTVMELSEKSALS